MAVTSEEFIRKWEEADRGGHSITWIAGQLGITRQAVYSRARTVRLSGITLPLLQHGNSLKKAQEQ